MQREQRAGKKLGERERRELSLPTPGPSLFSFSRTACAATTDTSLWVVTVSYLDIARVASVRSPYNLNTCNRSPSAGNQWLPFHVVANQE